MKILHTADWHLGKWLGPFSRIEEQKEVLDEICQIANDQQVDLVLVAGDLFDTFNAPTEAVDLLYKTLKRLTNNGTRPVIAIAGNHDSPERIEAPDPLAKECGIFFVGYPDTQLETISLESGIQITKTDKGFLELQLPKLKYPIRCIVTPYANTMRMKACLSLDNEEQELRELLGAHWKHLADTYCDKAGVNLLVTHLYVSEEGGNQPEEPEDEKPILHIGGAQAIFTKQIPEQMQYVALGHLHRLQTVGKTPCPVVYSSSPLCYSFSEAGQKKKVVLAELEPGKAAITTPIELHKGKTLSRKRFESIADAVTWLEANPDHLVELTLVSETYLSSEDRKSLSAAHQGIVAIIPEIKNQGTDLESKLPTIDLTKSMESLFADYFTHTKKQAPPESILQLFKELLAEDSTAL
jgi:exonuclease SbcD